MSDEKPRKKALAMTLRLNEKILIGDDLEIVPSSKNHATQIRLIFLTTDGKLPIKRVQNNVNQVKS